MPLIDADGHLEESPATLLMTTLIPLPFAATEGRQHGWDDLLDARRTTLSTAAGKGLPQLGNPRELQWPAVASR